jgi:tetratricopeptide (TPR) repeat protein
MKRAIWIVCAAALVAVACGGQHEGGASSPKNVAARQAEWKWLEESKQQLDAKRQELASLHDQARAGAAVGASIDAINAEIVRLSEEHGRRLAEYINADPPILGEPLKPEQAAAIRMKSSEDIHIAREFIELGGDYRKAIDIYTSALAIDPDNADLQAALADAESKRYMTAERFAQVRRGMNEAAGRRRDRPTAGAQHPPVPGAQGLRLVLPEERAGGSGRRLFQRPAVGLLDRLQRRQAHRPAVVAAPPGRARRPALTGNGARA